MPDGKKKSNVGYKSEWNMTELDFKRMHEILKHIDEYSFQSTIGKTNNQMKYLCSLKALYRYIRPLLVEPKQKEYDRVFKNLRKEASTGNDIVEKIEDLHDDLMKIRQFAGMGMSISPKVRDPTSKYLKKDIYE